MSDAAPTRSLIRSPFEASSLQLQCGLADADLVAGLELDRARDALAIQIGAVRRPEVLHEPHAVLRIQARVEARHIGVVELDVTGVGPSDLHRPVETLGL